VSIKSKLRAIVMLASTIAVILACAAFVTVDLIGMRRSIESDLTTLAGIMGENVSTPLVFRDVQTAKDVLGALHGDPSIVTAVIYAKDGRPFASYRALGGDFNTIRVHIERPIVFDGEVVGRIAVGSDLREITARLRNYAAGVLAILVLSLSVAFIVANRLQRVISTPIVQLAGLMGRVRSHKNYALRAPAHSAHDEIGSLIDGFNEMLAEVQRRDDDVSRHNQMILDAAGEGILSLDARGVVTLINPSGAKMLGAMPSALIGRTIPEFAPLTDRAAKPVVYLERDGRSIPVEYTANAILDDAGVSSGVVVTFRDISERLAVDRMKDEFVSCAQSVVLLVEDDLDLAGVIATALQAHGITTIHAPNGREAIEACAQRTPDMAILDVVLPELDGFAVVDWMKRHPSLSRLPLLVYSAKEVSVSDQDRLRLGPTEFLTKTRVSLEQFEQNVVRLLHRLNHEEVAGAA